MTVQSVYCEMETALCSYELQPVIFDSAILLMVVLLKPQGYQYGSFRARIL